MIELKDTGKVVWDGPYVEMNLDTHETVAVGDFKMDTASVSSEAWDCLGRAYADSFKEWFADPTTKAKILAYKERMLARKAESEATHV